MSSNGITDLTTSELKKKALRKKVKVALISLAVLIIGGILLGVGGLLLWWGETDGWLLDWFTWIDSIGYWGNLIIIIIYIPTSFPFVLGYALLTLLCGFLFRFWLGLLTVIIGSQFGILAVFIIVNVFFKAKTQQWVEKSGGKHANAIMQEITLHKGKFSLFLRMLPLPIGLQNCMLAVSPIPLWMYQLTSGFGLLVKQIPEVYIGSTLGELADIISGEQDFGFAQAVPIVIGFLAVCIFVIFIVFISRRVIARLKDMEEQELDETAEEVIVELQETEEDLDVPIECEVFCDTSAGVLPGSLDSVKKTGSTINNQHNLDNSFPDEIPMKDFAQLPSSTQQDENITTHTDITRQKKDHDVLNSEIHNITAYDEQL